MNVKERNYPLENSLSACRFTRPSGETENTVSDSSKASGADEEELLVSSLKDAEKTSQGSAASGKMKSSLPDDSVGQLAAELSHAETRLDVNQVLSKATRALASLKMSAYTCEGADAKKALQMIKRMEKLIKRIQKKLKQLSKEEQMELQQKKAEKEKEVQKARQIREELRSKRRRRRRDERNYAMKELAEDGKEAVNETISSVIGAGTALSGPETAMYNASGGIDLSSVPLEGMSIDVSV